MSDKPDNPSPEEVSVNCSRHAYKTLFRADEKNSAYRLFSHLVELFPDHHVSRVDFNDCDLLSFAESGQATAELLNISDGDRTYIPAAPLSGHLDDPDTDRYYSSTYARKKILQQAESDRLVDTVNWGVYDYRWEGMKFLVFRYVFWTRMESTRKFFVLSPKSEGVSEDGLHSPQSDKLIRTASRWQTKLHEEIYVFDDGEWFKSKSLWRTVRDSSWDDVILDPQTKDALIDDVHGFFASQSLYEEYSVPWKRGVILHGVPGNGKTLSIKALMATLNTSADGSGEARPIPSLYVKSLQNCHGGQYAIRSIFHKARSSAPCMLIFEDLDSLVTKKLRSYFLNEVDGLESNNGILMIGSTNHLTSLDPAIANRPSRFDRKYHFALPQKQERLAYANYWRKKVERNQKITLSEKMCELIADWTAEFSFAYLKELFVSALLNAARGGPAISEQDEQSETAQGDKNFVVVGDNVSSTETTSSGDDDKDAKTANAPKGSKEKNAGIKIPTMDIPDDLKDNVLLRSMKQQVAVLLREMDTARSLDDGGKSKKKLKLVNDDSDASDSDSDAESVELTEIRATQMAVPIRG